MKKIQVIAYILTNINYIVLGCHCCSLGVVMGRRCHWCVVLGHCAVGGCWRWAIVEDGGWCSPLVGWGALCGCWCWAVLAIGRGRWWAMFAVGMGSW